MIVVKKVKQTTPCFPTQWEGELSDGRIIYARYRSETLRVGIGDTLDDAVSCGWLDYKGNGKEIVHKEVKTETGGELSYDQLIKNTKSIITWPKFYR